MATTHKNTTGKYCGKLMKENLENTKKRTKNIDEKKSYSKKI